jgi:hypothetical protein
MSPAHLVLPDLIVIIILGEQYKLLSSSLCNFLLPNAIFFSVGLHIFQRLFSETAQIYGSSLKLRYQVTNLCLREKIKVSLHFKREVIFSCATKR